MAAERRLLAACTAVAVTVVAFGLAYEARGHVLGTALPPFVMSAGARADALWTTAAAAVLAALVALAPRLRAIHLGPAALAAALTVNAARSGPDAWDAIFTTSFEAKNEYLPGLPALRYGAGFFLDRFAELVPALPVNVAGHPPGLLLALDATGLATPGRMTAVCIAAAAAVPPLTYALARQVGGREPARVAALLALLSPALLLFGTTSADAVYAALGTAAAALLAARRPALRAAGAAVLAVAAFASWALLAIGAYAALLALLREGRRAAAALAAGCAVAVVGSQALLAAATGYDPLGTLAATETYYRHSLAEIRPYWFWVLGSPVAFLVTLGLPTAGAVLLAAARRQPEALAAAAVLVIAALLGFTKAEVERIWLPFVPLVCVAAATAVPAGRLRAVAALLAGQALGTSLLFATIW